MIIFAAAPACEFSVLSLSSSLLYCNDNIIFKWVWHKRENFVLYGVAQCVRVLHAVHSSSGSCVSNVAPVAGSFCVLQLE